MDGFVEMAASLLSLAHAIFGPGIWPGEWLWATAAAGALVALIPTAGTLLIAVIRKGTGNQYNTATLSVFTAIGVLTALVLPWFLFGGISGVYDLVRSGQGAQTGLTSTELQTFSKSFKPFGPQAEYLGGGQTVYEAITDPNGGLAAIFNVIKLIILPALCLLFMILQARTAMRRGPKWPGRLIWLPFLVFVLLSAPVSANTAGFLWAGFLPVTVLGLVPLMVIGPPGWTTIKRSHQEEQPAGDGGHHDRQSPRSQAMPSQAAPNQAGQNQAGQSQAAPSQAGPTQVVHNQSQPNKPPANLPPTRQQMTQQPRNPPPYQPEPSPPPYVPEPLPHANQLLSGQQPGQQLLSGQNPPPRLSADPGPLPFAVPGGGGQPPTTKAMPRGDSMWTQSGGRFRKVRPLGQGGFGTVWLAVDTQLDRTVAVKMAHVPDDETEQRMLREARALAAVRHPNCVRVYDIVKNADGLGIVMEYIEGSPLADTVQENSPLDDVAAARLWVTMAGALNAAHAKGVLHRDVKPSNVVIDPTGSPHLLDFGIARTKGDSSLTATGMMVGTPDFLAPETAAGADATPASDAWQLAATVSYALTGHPPRGSRENPMAALMAAAKAEPNTYLPARSAHRRLLEAALGPDPARRPTLQTIIEQTGGWLANAGHSEEGPVTRIVSRDDLKRPHPNPGQPGPGQPSQGQPNQGQPGSGNQGRPRPNPTRVMGE